MIDLQHSKGIEPSTRKRLKKTESDEARETESTMMGKGTHESEKNYPRVWEILDIHAEKPQFLSLKEELITKALERSNVRERIVKKVVKELSDD